MISVLLPHWFLRIVSSQRGGAVCILIFVILSASSDYKPNEWMTECTAIQDNFVHLLQMKSYGSREGSHSFRKGFAFNEGGSVIRDQPMEGYPDDRGHGALDAFVPRWA